MKTKAKSVQVFEIRMWSRKHYGNKTTQQNSIYQGQIVDAKSKNHGWFRTPGKLLTLIEKLYLEAEKKR